MTDGASPKASSVEGAAISVPGQAVQNDTSAIGHDQDKAVEPHGEAETATATATTTSDFKLPPAEEEKGSPVEQSTDSSSVAIGNGHSKNAEEAGNGDAQELEDEEANIDFPSGLQLSLLTFGLCMATFVVALDNTIIATAIPQITTVFNSLGDVGWYGSSYLLTTTALQPSFGRIYTYFNVKYTYACALFLFEVGSVLCAAATDSTMLIIGRAVAGAGASAIFSGGMTIVGFTVPLRKRPLYIAMLASMFGISSVVGPLLGGVFTDKVSWRWCFWINLPFGAIAIATVWFFFKPPVRKSSGLNRKQKIFEIDLLGALFLIAAVVCLLLALQWGGFTYSWSDSKVWGCLLGFGLMIIVFIVQQFRRGDRATIPPRIFGQRTVLFCALYTCTLNMAIYTHLFYIPFYFQAVKGTSAVDSGIRTIPYLASIIISSLVVGAGITVVGIYKPFLIVGAMIFTVGAGMIYTLAMDSSAGIWIGYQLLAGLGAGAGVQVPFIAIQVVLNSKDMPTGNSIAIFFNSLGGAISISVAQNIFVNGLVAKIPLYAPDINPLLIFHAGATHIREVVPPASLAGVLEAYMLSLNQAFVLPIAAGGIAVALSCFVESKSVKGKKLVPAAA